MECLFKAMAKALMQCIFRNFQFIRWSLDFMDVFATQPRQRSRNPAKSIVEKISIKYVLKSVAFEQAKSGRWRAHHQRVAKNDMQVTNIIDVKPCAHPVRRLEDSRLFRPIRPNDQNSSLAEYFTKTLKILRHFVQVPLRISLPHNVEGRPQHTSTRFRNLQPGAEAINGPNNNDFEWVPLIMRVEFQFIRRYSLFLDSEKRVSKLTSFFPE